VSRIRKKTFYLQFCMGTPEVNLQAESKILKKFQNKKNLKKTVFRTLEVKRGQKYARTEFAGPTQNPK
jgi:ribosomal protein S6